MNFDLKKIGFPLVAILLIWSGLALGSSWNTFLGSSAEDKGQGIAVDGSGNIYVTGSSLATWGSPPGDMGFKDSSDVFVAKLNSSGQLLWNVFLGSAANDQGQGIAVDGSGNVFVTGYSNAAWSTTNTPVLGFTSGGSDAFVAKLYGATGALIWHTFLGSAATDTGRSIAVDQSGNAYVTGTSNAVWGTQPVRGFSGVSDAFAAKLDGGTGALIWHTFLGSYDADSGQGIAVDNGFAYVTGSSGAAWSTPPSPVASFSGSSDAFAAKLNRDTGALQWYTFLGSASQDYGRGIAVDGSGSVFVAGYGDGAWGSPPTGMGYKGGGDAFVAKLDAIGALQWNSFLGSTSPDDVQGIALDGIGNVYVAGRSDAGWGSPEKTVNPYSGNSDAFAAKLDGSGNLVWNTFLGSNSYDYGQGIAVDLNGNVSLVGYSQYTWGSPILPFAPGSAAGVSDAFVAGLSYNLKTISGTVRINGVTPLAGVVLSGLPGNPVTDASGNYTATVPPGWNGTVTPTLLSYTFTPASMVYSDVQSNQTTDYTATLVTTYAISGTVRIGGVTPLSGVVLNGFPGSAPVTDGSGNYSASVNTGWTGVVTPSLTGYTFNPTNRPTGPVAANTPNQDYTATLLTYTISGTIRNGASPLPGVAMNGLPGNPVTNASGFYTATVDYGWSHTVTPTLAGYAFEPSMASYVNVKSNATQDYQATPTFVISGKVWVGGFGQPNVVMNGLPGNPVTNSLGNYTAIVPQGWSGTVMPTLEGFSFTPPYFVYTNVIAGQPPKDYFGVRVFTISGTVTQGGVGLAYVVLSGLPDSPLTDSAGYYSATVYQGWNGTVTPVQVGYRFTPDSLSYSSVNAAQSNQDYMATAVRTYTISGYVKEGGAALPGVALTAGPGESTVTGSDGFYQMVVNENWSGTITPGKEGYRFSPASWSYSLLNADQPGKDYTAFLRRTISGYVKERGQALVGVPLNFVPGDSTFTDGTGRYQITVDQGWSGTVTPAASGYQFSPQNRTYDHLSLDQPSQDYSVGSTVYLPVVLKPN